MYTTSVMFMKLSIVALYWRLFGLTRKARIPLGIMGGIIVAWGIAIVGLLTHQPRILGLTRSH